jgi:general secretion pathway protein K
VGTETSKRRFFESKQQKPFGRFASGETNAAQQGFALLVVLWSVVFLAFLMTQILAGSRTAISLASNLRAAAQARAADDGAIDEAIFHALATGRDNWPPDGAPHLLTIGGLGVSLRIETLAGRVNPNIASGALLAGLLHAAGEPGNTAAQLAQNILDWRSPAASLQAAAALADTYRAAGLPYGPPATQFADLDQLSDVLGFTPALLAALKPHLSLYQPGDPDPKVADPIVRQAIAFADATNPIGTGSEGAPAIRITACAVGPARTCRNAAVSLDGPNALPPYQIEQLTDGQ